MGENDTDAEHLVWLIDYYMKRDDNLIDIGDLRLAFDEAWLDCDIIHFDLEVQPSDTVFLEFVETSFGYKMERK